MGHWVNKVQWTVANAPATGRRRGFNKSGSQGNKVDPTTYNAYYGQFPLTTPRLSSGAYQPDVDVPNLVFVSSFFGSPVPFGAARNSAWSSFIAGVRSHPASLGVAFAEMGESLEMIANRASQLYRGYRDLRRGNFRDFLRTFGIGAKRRHKNKLRNAANEASSLWLEYSFGWKPLSQDIYEGINAIGQPVPGNPVRGRGRGTYKRDTTAESYDTVGRCRMGAFVSVSNPNLYLAQQMGLANPLLIAWELVPFSFVVDWVFDVGTCLGAISDLYGCSVTRAYTSYAAKGPVTCKWEPSGAHMLKGYVAVHKRHTGLDFPFPNTSFRANIGGSLQRAANAVSLLGQILTK